MRGTSLLSGLVVAALIGLFATVSGPGTAASGECSTAPTAAERFDMIKKLEGDWIEIDDAGKPTGKVISTFRVTAGGSAVEEILFAGTDHEMITLYHMDGADLVLTHYCVSGNQPRMKAEPMTMDGTLTFACAGGSNMVSEDDKHMHRAVITWLDDDHLHSEWHEFTGGENTYTASFKLVRK